MTGQRRQVFIRLAALVLGLCIGFLVVEIDRQPNPVRPRPTAIAATPLPIATRVPAPIPFPTISPLLVQPRAVSAPDAPVLLPGPDSAVVNVACQGECVLGGGPNWVTSDVLVKWTHPDPASVDEYQVWRSRMEPYFEPETCTACSLAGTTSGLETVVADSPARFNPVGGTEGADITSGIDVYVVRATNAGGTSVSSNRIGVVSWSLLQGITAPPPGMQ